MCISNLGMLIFGWRPFMCGLWCKRTQTCIYKRVPWQVTEVEYSRVFWTPKQSCNILCLGFVFLFFFFFFSVGALFTTNLCHHQCYFCVYEHSKNLRALSASPIRDICSWYSVDVSLHCRDDSKNAYPWDS